MTTRQRQAGLWITALGLVAIAAATLSPGGGGGTSFLCIVCGPLGGIDVLQNIVLFVPLGFGLGLARFGLWRAAIFSLVVTVTIEFLQFQLIPGRDSSAGDILMNSVGGVIGAMVGHYFDPLVAPPPRLAVGLAGAWSVLFVAVQLVGAHALMPELPPGPYYGQIARTLGPNLSGFPGDVSSPMIGGDTVRDFSVTPARTKELLAREEGTPVSVFVAPRSCPSTTASIVHLADGKRREILTLAQHGADLIYGIRTGAEALRLRPVRYRLTGVFGEGGTCEVLRGRVALRAQLTRSRVFLAADRTTGSLAAEITPRIEQSWRLIAPWQTYMSVTGGAALVSALWMLVLVLPISYWGSAAGASLGPAWTALVVLGTFVLIPLAYSLSSFSLGAWTAAGAGIAIGAALARRTRRNMEPPVGAER